MSRADRSNAAPIDAHVVVRRGGVDIDARVRVEHGETAAILAAHGAGARTVLAAISGAQRLTGGSIAFGNDVTATRHRHVRPRRRGVVLLGRNPRLFEQMTVRDNVAFGLHGRGLDGKHARGEADEWLWQVGLGGSGDQRPRQLDAGARQRVAIARALAAAPRAVLLDDPLATLDPVTASELRTLLHERLMSSRIAALLFTRDVTDVAALARRVFILERGRVTQEGATADVLTQPATPFAAEAIGVNRVVGTGASGGCLVKASEGPVRIGGDGPGGEVRANTVRTTTSALAIPAGPPPAEREGKRVVALFRPNDVRLAPAGDASWTGALRLAREAEPEPGEWLARVVRLDSAPDGALVVTDAPRVAAWVPADRVARLRLAPGDPVRLSVPAHRVRIVAGVRRSGKPGAQAGSDG